MIKLNFNKLINEPETLSLIRNLTGSLGESCQIFDADGKKIFFGVELEFCDSYPIYAGEILLGWVTGSSKVAVVAETLSCIASKELLKKSLAHETLTKYEEVNLIYDISNKIATCNGVKEVTELIVEQIKKIFKANNVTVMLLNEATDILETISLENEQLTLIPAQKAGAGIAGNVLVSGQAEIVNNANFDLRYVSQEPNVHSLICAPLIIQNKAIGVIKVFSEEYEEFTTEQLKLFSTLTSQAAAAIQTAHYYEKLKEYSHELELKVAQRTLALEKANQQLQVLADLDGLTQVANRRRFDEYLCSEWLYLAHSATPMSLILCDVDYFKDYNDYYGHLAGDDCLKQIARLLSNVLQRPSDLLARYGGEEFAILMPKANVCDAIELVEIIRAHMNNLKIPHQTSQLDCKHLTLTFGISCLIPTLYYDPQSLINTADKALYQAKVSGRDRYHVHF